MRRLMVVVIAMSVVSGCATSAQNHAGARAGGVTMAIGAITVAVSGVTYIAASKPLCGTGPSTEDIDCDPDRDLQRSSKFAAIFGAVLIAGGLVSAMSFLAAADRTEEVEHADARAQGALEWQRAQEQLLDRQRNRDRAWTLTKEAAEAGRAGDCPGVMSRGRDVLALDPEFHATVFVRDVAIAGCLANAGILGAFVAPPPLPPPPPPRDRIKDREQAFSLTKSAADAARAGTCATVLELQPKVRELDVNVHDAWFVRDAAIKKCLDAATAAPVAP
jgi:hypothetical protein